MSLYPAVHSAQEELYIDEPPLDFIEFLGEWETWDGEWIDPNEFVAESYAAADESEEALIEDKEEENE